jgi:hypothetical protein
VFDLDDDIQEGNRPDAAARVMAALWSWGASCARSCADAI